MQLVRLWIVQEIDRGVSRKRRLVHVVPQSYFRLEMAMRRPVGGGVRDQQKKARERNDAATHFRKRRSRLHVLSSMNLMPRPRISLPATECGRSAKHAPCFSINCVAS